MDDFQPALTTTETDTTAPDAADPVIAPASAEPDPEARPPRGPRQMNDKTRALFAKIIEKHRGAEGESLEADELVPAVTNEPSEAGAESTTAATSPPSTQDAAKPEAAPAAPTPAPAQPAPAPSPAADVAARAIEQQRLAAAEAREKAIADREAKLAEREKAIPNREAFIEKPGATLKELIKLWTGADNDADLKLAIEDAVSELTSEGLGVPLPPDLKQTIESRKAIRSVKAWKSETQRQQEAAAKEREAALEIQRKTHAQSALSYALTQTTDTAGKPYKERFPYLMAEDNPHLIVWEVLEQQQKQDPNGKPNWESAAELTEKYLKDQADAYIARRRHLLNPAPPQAPAKADVTQGAGPQNRQPAQTQSKPTPQTPPKPEAPSSDEPLSREERRRRSLARMAKARETAP